MMKELIKKYGEIIRYLIVGGLTTVVSLSSYFVCVEFFLNPQSAVELQIANVISWIAAVIFAYITNRIFVFESKNKNIMSEITKFLVARIGSLAMDMGIMYVTVTLLHMNDKFAKLFVQVIVVIANYVLSKWIVFNE